jgi:phage terminase large subunit
MKLNINLREFWFNGSDLSVLRPARFRVLYGGRASSKSHEFATMLIVLMLRSRITVLCTRAFQNRIEDSVKNLLEQKIDFLSVSDQFITTKTNITCVNGSRVLFYGLSRNTAEIKSLEGVDICWIEEAQFITEQMFDILAPTIRKEGSEIWATFNPENRNDFFYKTFVVEKKSNSIVKKINYTENPFLSDTMLGEIKEFKTSSATKGRFGHVYLGECNDSGNSCIPYSIFANSITSKYKKSKTLIIGVDVGDGGEDPSAVCLYDTDTIVDCYEIEHKRDDFEFLADKIMSILTGYKNYVLKYDSVGVGAGFGAIMRMKIKKVGVKCDVVRFVASNSPTHKNSFYRSAGEATQIKNKDLFMNLKIQQWVLFRDKLLNGELLLYNNIKYLDKLKIELSTPSIVAKEDRKIRLESKDELKKRGVPSHNLADSAIIAVSEINQGWR